MINKSNNKTKWKIERIRKTAAKEKSIQKITQQVQLSMEVKHFVIISTLRKTISTTYKRHILSRSLLLLLVIGSIVCTRKSSSFASLTIFRSFAYLLVHSLTMSLQLFSIFSCILYLSIPSISPTPPLSLPRSISFAAMIKEKVMFYPMYTH